MTTKTDALHVHDFPQLYKKPTLDDLVRILDKLKIQPFSFSALDPTRHQPTQQTEIDPEGVPRYLTSIISSSLSWLDDDARERVWTLASTRLSERAGRTAMPSMNRAFEIKKDLIITLFEPSLTEDNLGFKTWTSSLLLARRLESLKIHIPSSCDRVLELGAGTGLVGIAAACLWKVAVSLTDLAEIVPNLTLNIESNRGLLENHGAKATAEVLDWADSSVIPADDGRFQVIVAADPIYTRDHPKMLVDTLCRWLDRSTTSRFILELPIREAYGEERNDLKVRLCASDLVLIEEGIETGYDDWQGEDGQPAEVTCWWSVWAPK